MERDERLQLENLDKLIEQKENLKKLTEQPAWKDLMKIMAELRVDALDSAVREGDTKDQKAFARALGTLISIFYSWEDDTYKDDIVDRKKMILHEIDQIERERLSRESNLNIGLGSTI